MDSSSMDFPSIAELKQIVLSYNSSMGPTEVTFGDIDTFAKNNVIRGIAFGLRAGLGFMGLIMTYALTKAKNTPAFYLNMGSLFLLFVHSILYCCLLTDWYSSATYTFSMYIPIDRSASILTCISNVLFTLFIGFVEASFVLQVRSLFLSQKPTRNEKRIGWFITLFTAGLGLTTTGFYAAYMVIANRISFDNNLSPITWVANVPPWCFTVSTIVMCMLLTYKLISGIMRRRRLGKTQFNEYHAFLIMVCQTMVVPTVLMVSSDITINGNPTAPHALQAIGTGLVALSLPFTTMWAKSAADSEIPSSCADSFASVLNYNSYRGYNSISPTTMTESFDFEAKMNDSPDSYTAGGSPKTLVSGDQKTVDSHSHDDDDVYDQIIRYTQGVPDSELAKM